MSCMRLSVQFIFLIHAIPKFYCYCAHNLRFCNITITEIGFGSAWWNEKLVQAVLQNFGSFSSISYDGNYSFRQGTVAMTFSATWIARGTLTHPIGRHSLIGLTFNNFCLYLILIMVSSQGSELDSKDKSFVIDSETDDSELWAKKKELTTHSRPSRYQSQDFVLSLYCWAHKILELNIASHSCIYPLYLVHLRLTVYLAAESANESCMWRVNGPECLHCLLEGNTSASMHEA